MLTLIPFPKNINNTKIFKEKEVLEAVEGSLGVFINVGRKLGCTAKVAKRNIQYYLSAIKAFEEEDIVLVDLATSSLRRLLNDNDAPTVRWVLKYLKPDKFSEEMPGLVDQSITLNISMPDGSTPEELLLAAEQLKRLRATN